MRVFSRCEIVGRRFPICHVHIGDTIVEVSSFSTSTRKSNMHLRYEFGKPVALIIGSCRCENDCSSSAALPENGSFFFLPIPVFLFLLFMCLYCHRLMFDPYAKIVYDYVAGIEDIKKAKVRTVIPASSSFQEDCARILRAIRIAARLGFQISRETAHFVKNLSCSILRLDKGRLLMEMNYMLAYGSAEASLRLLWKFGLLEILLPIQAAYFVGTGFRRRDKRSNMLLSLFSNLDKLLAPDRPCHSSLCRQTKKLASGFSDWLGGPWFNVFISLALYLKACRIFGCVRDGPEERFLAKQGSKIDYESLALGSMQEVRHVFARIVFDTVYPFSLTQNTIPP
ncbi:uncharacterized protein LOC110807302 [Carica papaya]|uniref:uncharacterized protein LOC110807302 n=1 Tax=Carica papaya TaxID=3649 RepID=UPI000B8CB2D6|nr:uncharacterized protein LOC110807302 [Carica papaya]